MNAAPTGPFRVGLAVGGACVVGGFAAVFLGWRGVARTLAVEVQLPYLVSGGVAGLGLIVVGITVVLLQAERRQAAMERQRLRSVADRLADVVDASVSVRREPVSRPRG